VYRARDTKLNRDVALKILPQIFAQDSERMARFEREAQVLASLNHTNIAQIYGIESVPGTGPAVDGRQSTVVGQTPKTPHPKPTSGTKCLVLELVEGETLQEQIARGPIPVDEALKIALQICEGLEAAHEKGIIHRDLKPANIKITPEGQVKILDFGLAKALEGETPVSDLSHSPTITHAATQAGMILGTAAYMSPEQARGKAADRRADVWAFGVVLYEMLTGAGLFRGETVTDIIAAVVTRELDLDPLPKTTPAPVRRLLHRCLRRDPGIRLPDIGSARLVLHDTLTAALGEAEVPVEGLDEALDLARKLRRRGRWAWAAISLVLAVIAGTVGLVHWRESPPSRPLTHFVIEPAENWSFGQDDYPVPSPDGRRILFRAKGKGPNDAPMLWMRSLDSPTARALIGTEGASSGFWSPDGDSIGFFAQGEMRRLTLSEGNVQRLCSLPSPGLNFGDWNTNGTILFSSGRVLILSDPKGGYSVGISGHLYTVSDKGGQPRLMMEADKERQEIGLVTPQFLPDGRRFTYSSASSEAGVYLGSLDRPGERKLLISGARRLRYAAGQMLFSEEGTLYAQPFNLDRGELTGEVTPIASSVESAQPFNGIGRFGVSEEGTLAYYSAELDPGGVQLAWVDRHGTVVGRIGVPGRYHQLALSPDESKVAVEVLEGNQFDLWVMDLSRGVPNRFTATPGNERAPVWSPDGRSLAFSAQRNTENDMRQKGLRLDDTETVLGDLPGEREVPENWTADGKTLLFLRMAPAAPGQTVWALSAGDGEKIEPIFTKFRVDEPQLSPDMRWIAYMSRESGQDEVYIESFRREGDRVRISLEGGGQPKWRANGRELFYTTPSGMLMVVEVRTEGDRLEVGLPSELFKLENLQGGGYDDYAPAKDGQRFLVKVPIQQPEGPRLHIVTNWSELLEQDD
ncbi:MAG: protein kinase, partial [Acidobacteriota bacterium]